MELNGKQISKIEFDGRAITALSLGDVLIYTASKHFLNIVNDKVYYRPDGTGNADLVMIDNKPYARRVN